ncbi:M90 family metallopeptidase [uncultured Thiothrix sp.]|jgi:Mlc titration factor MtfA (ptsG expression regulator)|uniref:M90 family metallopeptidase n=1 Tax=uncultured Thiothrix sp. TaxID=223185 RepID=UPI0026108871|nr:M90 family metallopeptidase [uncultured Thiothrix sp.]
MSLSLGLMITIVLAALVAWLWPAYQRKQALKEPFPAEWRKILAKNFPVYRRMPADLQLQLRQRIKLFLHQKQFTGCAGLAITDEVRVTIAASACLLILNRVTDVYAGLRYILVYPNAFLVEEEAVDGAGLVSLQAKGMLGQSWSNGKIILSWADVLKGNREFNDGNNVALHEFAHQLDNESGGTNGVPVLASAEQYEHWATVLKAEFDALRQAAFQGDPTLINYYGATAPAEFFAVVTEVFFEQPKQLAAQHPALFEQLKAYYRVDPSDWL